MSLKIRQSIHSRKNDLRCSKARIRLRRPKRWWLDAAEFRDLRLSCLLNQRACAEFLGVAERSVRNWDSGRARVPKVVIRLMRLVRNGELDAISEPWSGWLLRGDRLISPEGRQFRPGDMSYWANTVAMARLWRSERAAARPSAEGSLQATARVADGSQGRMPAALPVGTRLVLMVELHSPLPSSAEPVLCISGGMREEERIGAKHLPLPGLVKIETSGGIDQENRLVMRVAGGQS